MSNLSVIPDSFPKTPAYIGLKSDRPKGMNDDYINEDGEMELFLITLDHREADEDQGIKFRGRIVTHEGYHAIEGDALRDHSLRFHHANGPFWGFPEHVKFNYQASRIAFGDKRVQRDEIDHRLLSPIYAGAGEIETPADHKWPAEMWNSEEFSFIIEELEHGFMPQNSLIAQYRLKFDVGHLLSVDSDRHEPTGMPDAKALIAAFSKK